MSLRLLGPALEPLTTRATDFATHVLIIGGLYLGLSALVALKNHLKQRQSQQQVHVTLVEPKAGLLNVLGIPRAIVDTEFAKTQYVPLEELQDVTFSHIVADDAHVQANLGAKTAPALPEVSLTFVQGSVTRLEQKSAEYKLNSLSATATVSFDFVVVAAGRNRLWPTSPLAHNYESYMDEMRQFHAAVLQSLKISVVGAGAVGIEIAGDIKTKFPEKEVCLIHPHERFPPEPLTDEFKDTIKDSLVRAGVTIMTGKRVVQPRSFDEARPKAETLSFTDGSALETDLTYFCTAFHNNTLLFLGPLAAYVLDKNNVHVNDHLQLEHPDTKQREAHMFAIGDLVEKPIIKSAGWALYMGRQVANNIVGLLFDNKLVEAFPDLTTMPRGMVIIAGNEEIVSELTGEVELNHKGYVEEYKDYCMGKIRVTLGA